MHLRFPAYGKLLFTGILAVSIVSTLPALTANAAAASSNPLETSASEYKTFLQEKLHVALPGTVHKGEFLSALAEALGVKPSGEPVVFKDLNASSPYYEEASALYQRGILTADTVRAQDRLSSIQAVQITLKAAGLKELAYTYPKAKADKTLAKLKLSSAQLGLQTAQELAAAIDTGLVPSSSYGELKPGAYVSQSFASLLIGQTLSVKGLYKHYLGYTSDSDIYVKLNDAYAQSDIIQSPELQKIVDTALEKNLVTGYNLKDNRFEANFVDSLAVIYGHSDLTHAIQLIGLLRSEGIEAKVQFEPKTSAFIYLKEWGEPGESDYYKVKQIANGNYIEYAKEYDIAFEFSNKADKARFDAIIAAYAKKDEDKQPGLIQGSWWQPLYYTISELPGYKEITNNKITYGAYYAQSFSLSPNSSSVIDGFKSIDPAVNVEHYDFWVDAPFYRYLNGESK